VEVLAFISGAANMPETREVVKCSPCGLVQFATTKCRRCKKTLEKPPEPERFLPVYVPMKSSTLVEFSHAVRELRVFRGWSQNDLSEAMGIVRSYIGKIERGACLPKPAQAYRLAAALKIPSPSLFFDSNLRRDFMAKEFLADPFLSEIASHLPRLRIAEREAVLSCLSVRFGVIRVK